MHLTHELTETERRSLHSVLTTVRDDPYRDYPAFAEAVAELAASGSVPSFFTDACRRVRADRRDSIDVHVLRNCPLDAEVPVLGNADPLTDKYARKTTFVAEALHQLFSQLTGAPLLAYATRFNGDFFTDVIAHDKYAGQQTGFTDGELVFHNDRTAHRVRADFITLLGMRCPENDLVYTGFVSGRELLVRLTEAEQKVLREPYFVTPFDVVSRDANRDLTKSEHHPILENTHSFRYLDTHTTAAADSPGEAKDALLALKNSLARAERTRHRIRTGDLFTFANQDGLHNREHIDVGDHHRTRERWLLKTYAFRDEARAKRFADEWVDAMPGRVGD